MYDIIFSRAWCQNIFQQDDEYITTELNYTFETLKNDSSINSWLPPIPIRMSKFNALGTYIDNEGFIYFQCVDYGIKNISINNVMKMYYNFMNIIILDIPQLLHNVLDELNLMFINSKPEPTNFKWSNGQMVIVKYHLDNQWYRGIILEVSILFHLQRIIFIFQNYLICWL